MIRGTAQSLPGVDLQAPRNGGGRRRAVQPDFILNMIEYRLGTNTSVSTVAKPSPVAIVTDMLTKNLRRLLLGTADGYPGGRQ